MRRLARHALPLAALVLAGCTAGLPPRVPTVEAPAVVPEQRAVPEAPPVTSPLGARAAEQARTLIGAPYRYGGRDPTGFDCSGLVWYVYQGLGVSLPRRAAEQRAALQPVDRDALAPGDLVFFYTPSDHVGIYVGDGAFVHAPSGGKQVSVASLSAPYFQLGFAGAGRVQAH